MELGAVHCLSDVDTVTSLSRYRIPSNLTEYWEEAGRLGCRTPWDIGGGDPVHVLTIPHRRLQRGVQGSQG